MSHSKRLQRFLSGAVAVTFFVTSAFTPVPMARALPAGRQAANVESPSFITSFSIPAEFGRVTDEIKGVEGRPVLVHIQEAHANYDAQKNIQNILGLLTRDYGIQKIFLEGAGHQLKPEIFQFFPKEMDLQQAANEKLMQAGELTGVEVFLMNQNGATGNAQRATERQRSLTVGRSTLSAPEAWGVEEAKSYAQNRETFRQVFKEHKNVDRFSAVVSQEWHKAATASSNKSLRDFLKHEIAFEGKQLPLADWLDLLKAEAGRALKLDLTQTQEQKDWPALVRFFRLKTLGSKIDQAQVAKEKKVFLADLGSRSIPAELLQKVARFLEHKNGEDLPSYQTRFNFEKLIELLPENYSFEAFPNIRLVIQQGILLSEVQGEMLQAEMKALAGKVTVHFVKTEQDKRLVEALHQQRLLEKLLRLELGREEYEEILSRKITPLTLMKELALAQGQGSAALDVPAGLERLYQMALNFYSGAIERENGMMKRTLGLMKDHKQTQAVLITGGFHSEGMKQKAIQAGISYVEITPRIGEVPEESSKNYLEALLGRRTVENSQIAALRAASDGRFLREVNPMNWRRELAGTGVRIADSLRSVPSITPDRVRQTVSSFLQKAIVEISITPETVPSFVRSEVRQKDEAKRLRASLKRIADQKAAGFKLLPSRDAELFTSFARLFRDLLDKSTNPLLWANAERLLVYYKERVDLLRESVRRSAKAFELIGSLEKIVDGTAAGFSLLKPADLLSFKLAAKVAIDFLLGGASAVSIGEAERVLRNYRGYVKELRRQNRSEVRENADRAKTKAALQKIAQGEDEGLKWLSFVGARDFRRMAREHLERFQYLGDETISGQPSPATKFLAFYVTSVSQGRSVREGKGEPQMPKGWGDIALLIKNLKRIADGKAKGFGLLRGADARSHQEAARAALLDVSPNTTAGVLATAEHVLRTYIKHVEIRRQMSRSEIRILGTFSVKMGEKGRFALPSKWRVHGEEYVAVIEPSQFRLRVYPEARWEKMLEQALSQNPGNERKASDDLHARSYSFTLDGHGRITLGKRLLSAMSFPTNTDYLLQGAGDSFLIVPVAYALSTAARSEARVAPKKEMEIFHFDQEGLKGYEELTPSKFLKEKGIDLESLRGSKVFLRSKANGIEYAITLSMVKGLVIHSMIDDLAKSARMLTVGDIVSIRAERTVSGARSEMRKTSESIQSLEMNPVSGDHIAIGLGRSFDVSMKLRTAPGTAKESLRATVHIVYQDRDGEKVYDQRIPSENISEVRDANHQVIPNEWVGKVTIKPEHTGHYRFKVNVKTTGLPEQEDPLFWASGDDATFNVHRIPSWFNTSQIHPYILWVPDLKSMGLPMTWEGIEALMKRQKETKGKNLFELSPFFAMDHDAFFAPRSRVATSPLLIDWSTVTEDAGETAVAKYRSFTQLDPGQSRRTAFNRYARYMGIWLYADYVAGKVWELGQQPVAGAVYSKKDFTSKEDLRDFILYEQFIGFEKIYHLLKSAREIGARVIYNVPYWESDDGAASHSKETRRFYLQENGKVSSPKFSNGQVLGGLAAWDETAIAQEVDRGGEDPRMVPFKFWAEQFYEVFQEDPTISFSGSRIDAIHMAGINPTDHSPAERISQNTRFWEAIADYFSEKDLLAVAEQLGGDEFSQTQLTRLGFLQYDIILDLWGREWITLGAFLGDPKNGLAAISRGHSVSVVATHDSARSPRTYLPLFFSLAAESNDLQGKLRSAAEVLNHTMEDSVQRAVFEPILKLFGPAFFVILHLGPQVEPFLLSLDARGTLASIKTETLDEKGVIVGAKWNTAVAGNLDFSPWIKKATEIREQNPAIGHSKMTLLPNNDPDHFATFAKTYQSNHLLIVANFSAKPQDIQCPVPFGVFGIQPVIPLVFTELVSGKSVILDSDQFSYAMEPGQVAVFRLDNVPSEKQQDKEPSKVIDPTISGPSGVAAQIVDSFMPSPVQSAARHSVNWDWNRKERQDHMLLPGQDLVVENVLPFKIVALEKATREQRTFLPTKTGAGYQVVVSGLESGEYDLDFWWDDHNAGNYDRFEGRSYQVEVIPGAKDIGTLKDPFYVALVQGHKNGAAKGLGQFISAQFDDAGRLLRAAIFASGSGMNFEGQEWGRDTMMALVGIAAMAREGESFWVWDEKIHEQRWVPAADVLKGIVRRWVTIDDRGRKRIDAFRKDGHIMYNVIGWAGDYVNGVNFNTVDAPLWFLEAVMGYVLATGDKDFLNETLRDGQTLSDVLWETVDRLRLAGSSYADGKNKPDPAIKISGYLSDRGMPEKSIQMDAGTGFIFCPHHKFTWMDTEFTWREGYPVEIQALWARSLKQWAEVVKLLNPSDPRIQELNIMAARVKGNIAKYFWNSSRQYPSDILGTDFDGRGFMTPEQSIRNGMDDQVITSNPVIAAWAGALDPQKAKQTLQVAEKELHIPGALRSRGPHEKNYYPDRGAAWLATGDGNAGYHSGQGWVWPLPVHMVAMAEHGIISPEEALVRLRLELASVQKRNSAHSLPELIDANPGANGDHQQGGPAAQTWSVALAAYAFKTLHESLRSEVRQGERPSQATILAVSGLSGIVGVSSAVIDHYAKAGQDHGARSELRQAIPKADELSWAQANTPRVAQEHIYSRQWECGLPMDLLEKIAAFYSSFEAGEISQATLTGGLGALMPDLFEGWAAIGMNVTGIHPLWNFIKNAPGKGYDQEGRRKLLADIIKQFLEKTDIEFEATLSVKGTPKTVFFRAYKTHTPVHKSPQYYIDAYTKLPDGKEEPFFQEVYDDHGKREEDMAFFAEASERLVQSLENDLNPDITLIDHEVFASLPARHLKKAKRVTLNHTVFRPGLFEAWEGHYDLLEFPEQLRSTIVHDGKIGIADFTAEVFHLISGVNLVEHLPALLKNIFRTAWHRVKGYYDREKQIRSTNGVFLPRWQSPSRRVLIERYKEELQIPRPAHQLPVEADDRPFFEELDKDQNREMRERFKDQNEWVVAGDVAELLIWLREKRDFTGEYDWLGNTFKNYQEKHTMNPEQLVEHLREMQELLVKAVGGNHPEDWAELRSRFGEAYELLLADPIAANVRRFVPYKGPDKYEEILKGIVAKAVGQAAEGVRASTLSEGSMVADEAIAQAGLKVEFSGKFLRPYEPLFSFWKAYKDGKDLNQERYQKEFEGLRNRLKGQPAVEELRNTLSRLLVGGRTFDVSEAHDRLRYIRFMTELLGLEDRIATLEDHTYYEAQIIFRGAQAGVMLSDEDLEASATSMMKVKCNGGEVAGPYAGSNPEIWTILKDKKTGEIVEVLNEKGEPNTAVITQDILREKLRTGEWELLDGVFVAYSDGEKSTQEGGGRRPSARSLLEALQTIKTLRSNPAIRRQRSYQAVSSSWKVDSLSQVMAQAHMIENMLKEDKEREAMFEQLKFEDSDYAMPMAASDFGWKTQHPFERHSAKGMGLFGMFRSFRNLKTWQRKTQGKPDGDPATRGMEALDSLKYHAYHGDIFKYLRKNVLDRLSPGLQPFKAKIETLEAQAQGADDRELVAFNLEAMDLTEKLLVRMAGDWFERYMQAGPEKAELLRREITQGVREDYQPWAEYIARYLEGHPNARVLRTRENKIRSFIFTGAGSKRAVMVNLNVGAPVHRERDEYFDGFKARTQVPIDEKTFRQLTGNASNVKYIQLREPKLKLSFRVRPKEELTSEVGIGIPMPSGIEVIQWVVMKWHHLLPGVKEKVEQQEPLAITPAMELIHEMGLTQSLLGIAGQDPSAMNSLKQLIRETRTGYKSPEGMDPADHFYEQLEVLADLDRDMAVNIFGENLKPMMGLIVLFRPDLLEASKMATWDESFGKKIGRAIAVMRTAFGEESIPGKQHNYYVLNSSHQGSLVLARKDAKGNAFFMTIQFAANAFDAAEDGKVSTRISSESLTRLIDEGVSYRVQDMLADEHYGDRNDLLQGWTIRIPYAGSGDRLQMLYLEKKTSENRSEARSDKKEGFQAQRSEMRAELDETDWTDNGVNIEALRKAGHPVGSITEAMDDREVFSSILSHQVLYLTPALDLNYDYAAYEERLIQMAVSKIGPALGALREAEDKQGQTRQRKVFILRGMVDPGTSKRIYETIKWNAHPQHDDDLDFDLVFQPDFTFRKSQSREVVESSVVFGLMNDTRPDLQKPTREVLDRIFGGADGKKEIQYINVRSAEMAKEMLLIYLGAKLAHFDDIAELSHAYGADLSVAAFGAGLDKRIRTLFTNPSLGFGGRLFTHLAWIYAQRLHKAATEMEGHTHQKIVSRRQQLDEKIQASVQRLDRGETMETILRDLPPPLHLLFLVRAILKINKQNILDFYNTIEREYEKLGHGKLLGKKVALLSVGYRSQGGNITASPALLLIERLMMDHGVSEFFVADPAAQEAFQKWVAKKQQENPRYRSVRFTYAKNIYEAVRAADLTVIPTDSNKDLWTLDIQELGRAAKGKPVFDGMNLFGLRADGSFNYKLEEVRKAGMNLIGVGRLPLGPAFDHQTGAYRLGDSTVIHAFEEYQKAIEERGPATKEPVSFRQKTVTMVGGGYVGLVTAANLAALGHRVHVVDIKSKQKEIDALNSPETAVPIYEPGLRDMIIAGKKAGLITFSTDLEAAVKDSSIVYLAVGTPSQETGEVELSYILKASEDVGDVILKHGGSKALVIKSTVTPDTFQRMDQVLKAKGLKLGKDYAPVSNPEFLREGQAIEDVTKPDRTVLGFYSGLGAEDRKRAEKEILELWYPLMAKHPHTVLMTDTASSTIIKYLANSFLAISITLSNIFAAIAESDSADFMEIRRLLTRDERIGNNAFLAPGAGYGGSCFPKDVLALHFSSKKSTGHELPLISVATGFNDFFKKAIVEKATQRIALHPRAQQPFEGKSFALLGMAFKADTDDMREASSVSVLRELLSRGATRVELHDPILSMPNAPAAEVVIDHFLDYLFKAYHEDADFKASLKRHNALLMVNEDPILREADYFKKHYFQDKFIKTGRVVFTKDLERLSPADAVFLMTEWSQYKDIDLARFKKPDGKLWVIDGRNLYYERRQEISRFADYMGVGTTLFTVRSEVRGGDEDDDPAVAEAEVFSKARLKEAVYVVGPETWLKRDDFESTARALAALIRIAAANGISLLFHASSIDIDNDAMLTLLGFSRLHERKIPAESVAFRLNDLHALARETGLDRALVRGTVLTQREYDALQSVKASNPALPDSPQEEKRFARDTLALRKTLREIGKIGERFLSHWAVQELKAHEDALRAWDVEFKDRHARRSARRKELLSDSKNFQRWVVQDSSEDRMDRMPPIVADQLKILHESGYFDSTPYQTIAHLEVSLDSEIRKALEESARQTPEAMRENLKKILSDLMRWKFLIESRMVSYRGLHEDPARPEAFLFFIKKILAQQTAQDILRAMAHSEDKPLAKFAKQVLEEESRVRIVREVGVYRPEELFQAHRALLHMRELIESRKSFYGLHGNGAEGNIMRLYGDMLKRIDQLFVAESPKEETQESPLKKVAQKWLSHLEGKEFAKKTLDFMNLFQKVWESDEKGWWVTALKADARKVHMPDSLRKGYRDLAKEILQLFHVGDGKEMDGALYRALYILPLQRSEVREMSLGATEAKLPERALAVQPLEKIDIVEKDLDALLSGLPVVVGEARAKNRAVLLRGVSSSPADDEYFQLIGFVPVATRQEVEKKILAGILAKIEANKGVQLVRQGKSLTVTANGETWDLVLTNGRYSQTFENFVGKNPQEREARSKGLDSLKTEMVNKKSVILRDPVKVLFELQDPKALAREVSLSETEIEAVVMTQVQYAQLKAAPPAAKAEVEAVAPKKNEQPSAKEKQLLEILAGLQSAWTAMENHWAVQEVAQQEKALSQWDRRFRQWRGELQGASEMFKKMAKKQALADVSVKVHHAIQSAMSPGVSEESAKSFRELQATWARHRGAAREVFRSLIVSPYQMITRQESSVREMLKNVEGSTEQQLQAQIKKVFSSLMALQALVQARAAALEASPVEGVHPEVQYFLIKNIVLRQQTHQMARQILRSGDEKLRNMVMETLGSELFLEPQKGRYGSVNYGDVRQALSLLKNSIINPRRDLYLEHAEPLLRVTAGRMYAELSKEIERLLTLDDDPIFAEELCPALDALTGVWFYDKEDMWFQGIKTASNTNPSGILDWRSIHYRALLHMILTPLYLRTTDDVVSFLERGEVGAQQQRSEIRTMPVTLEQILTINEAHGGGKAQGFRGVTEKLTDGIYSLLAYSYNAVEVVSAFFSQESPDQKLLTITSKPDSFLAKIRFASAKAALGVKTFSTGDVLVIGREFALEHGAIAAMRTVFGDVPVLVYTDQAKDLAFLEQLNVQLTLAHRPPVLVAKNPDEASNLFSEEARRLSKAGTAAIHFKALVFEAETLPEALVKQLSDVTVVTSRMFNNFLNFAGVRINALVQEVQAQFALKRSA